MILFGSSENTNTDNVPPPELNPNNSYQPQTALSTPTGFSPLTGELNTTEPKGHVLFESAAKTSAPAKPDPYKELREVGQKSVAELVFNKPKVNWDLGDKISGWLIDTTLNAYGSAVIQKKLASDYTPWVAEGSAPKDIYESVPKSEQSVLQDIGDSLDFAVNAVTLAYPGSALTKTGTSQLLSRTAMLKNLGGPAREIGKRLIMQSAKRLAIEGAKEGALISLTQGVSDVLRNQIKDPKEIAQTLALYTAGGTVLGAAGNVILPLTVRALSVATKTGVKSAKQVFVTMEKELLNLEEKFVSQGYTREEARRLARQGGYTENPLASVTAQPKNEGIIKPPATTPLANATGSAVKQKERGLLTSMKESKTFGAIAKDLQSNYDVYTNEQAIKKARNLIGESPQKAEQFLRDAPVSADTTTTGILLAEELQHTDIGAAKRGALLGLEKLTSGAQATQAANILNSIENNPSSAFYKAVAKVESLIREKTPTFVPVINKIEAEINTLNRKLAEEVTKIPVFKVAQTKVTDLAKKMAKSMIDPAEDLARRITPFVKAQKTNPVKDMIETLFKVAQEELPKRAKKPPRDMLEMIKNLVENLDTYKEVWLKAQPLVRERWKDNPKAMTLLNNFFERTFLSGKTTHAGLPIPKSMLKTALKQQMKTEGINLSQIVREHYSVVNARKEDLVKKFTAGMSAHDAMQLATIVDKEFKAMGQDQKKAILDRLVKELELKPKNVKDAVDKMIELSNLGALDRMDVREIVGKKLKIPDLSTEDAKQIVKMADAVQNMPVGSRERSYAAALIEKKINNLEIDTKLEKAVAVWKANLFSVISLGVGAPGNIATGVLDLNKEFFSASIDKLWYMAGLSSKRTKTFNFPEFYGAYKSGMKEAFGQTKKYRETGLGDTLVDYYKRKLKEVGTDVYHKDITFDNGLANMFVTKKMRIFGVVDKPFMNGRFYASLYEQARTMATNEGLSGQALKNRMKEIIKAPTDEVVHGAIDEATRGVLQQENIPAKLIGVSKSWLKKHAQPIYAISELIIPIVQIPTNMVITTMIDYNLPGLIRLANPKNRSQKFVMNQLGKTLTGSTLMALGATLAAKGLMTGDYPEDAQTQDEWRAEGKTENAIKIGDRWFNLSYAFGPFGMLLSIGADLNRISTEEGKIEAVKQIGFVGVKKMADQPFLTGLSGLIKASQQPQTQSEKYLGGVASSVIPGDVNLFAKATNRYQRTPDGILETVQNRLPYFSNQLPVRYDMYGNPVESPRPDFLRSKKATDYKFTAEVKRVGAKISEPSDKMFNDKLNKAEYSKYSEFVGSMKKILVEEVLNSEEYQGLTDIEKKETLETEVRNLEKDAREYFYPKMMKERYGISPEVDGAVLVEILDYLNKKPEFKKKSDKEKSKDIQEMLNLMSNQ